MILSLRSPIDCSLQTGDWGESVVQFQSELEGLSIRRADGVSPDGRRRPRSQLNSLAERKQLSLPPHFVL